MKPTQAQIEAAAKALKEIFGGVLNDNRMADQTLNIAATAALAAAQVGEPTESERWRAVASHIEAATIERCARLAENMGNLSVSQKDTICREIAAAIRKLKNEEIK